MCVHTDTEDTSNQRINVKPDGPRVDSVLVFLPQVPSIAVVAFAGLSGRPQPTIPELIPSTASALKLELSG